jgi:hypothetical protein
VRQDLKTELLKQITWHDLPLTALHLTESACTLRIAPFCEPTQRYKEARLSLSGYESLTLDLQGALTPAEQRNLEIYRFDYELHEDGSLSGRLSILPGGAGYWSLTFRRAAWELLMTDRESCSEER